MVSADARLGRVEEAIGFLKDDREQARVARAEIITELKDMRGAVNGLTTTVRATADGVARLNLERCGERLDEHAACIASLKNATKNLAIIETEVMFWRRLLGGGFSAAWKIALVLLGTGSASAALTKWLFS